MTGGKSLSKVIDDRKQGLQKRILEQLLIVTSSKGGLN
jgi:hypothetical protein